MNLRARASRQPGLSLLEVMLALAILGGALAVIGELTRLGARNAEMARDLVTAQRLCENKMEEISAGLVLPETVTSAPVEELADQMDWMYSIQVEPLDQQGLLCVWVTVEQNPALIGRPVSFSLVRWMIDPELLATQSSDLTGESTSSSGGQSAATSAGGTGSLP